MNFTKVGENALTPTRKHALDAGLDVYAAHESIIAPHDFGIVRTGISVSVPPGYVCQVWPKSKSDYLVCCWNCYTGELLVKIANTSAYPLGIGKGTPVAQLVLVPVIRPDIVEVDLHTASSSRGSTGGIVTQACELVELSAEEVEKEWPDLT